MCHGDKSRLNLKVFAFIALLATNVLFSGLAVAGGAIRSRDNHEAYMRKSWVVMAYD